LVIYRPGFLCNDECPKLDAIRHAVNVVEIEYGDKFDCIIDLDVTNPLRKVSDIEACFQIFKEKRSKTVVSVTKAKKNPYMNQLQKFKHWETPAIENCNGQAVFTRRQNAPEVYDVNSCIYVYDRKWLDEKSQSPITDDTEIYVMEDWQFCDIDNAVDFFMVEKLMEEYLN
jgi:CMP-N,N'-diacetyllegionaminic acid synthase